jgi:hypothetical protein
MLEDVTEGLSMEERKLALAVQGQSYGPMFDDFSDRSLLASRQRDPGGGEGHLSLQQDW